MGGKNRTPQNSRGGPRTSALPQSPERLEDGREDIQDPSRHKLTHLGGGGKGTSSIHLRESRMGGNNGKGKKRGTDKLIINAPNKK